MEQYIAPYAIDPLGETTIAKHTVALRCFFKHFENLKKNPTSLLCPEYPQSNRNNFRISLKLHLKHTFKVLSIFKLGMLNN